ncbi:MAG: serine hydrolase domain-containing protein [Micropepsaceae bacterium]
MLRHHTARFIVFLLVVALVAFVPTKSHATPAKAEARATAMIAALSTGDAATYERAAHENFSKALLARRTPEARAQLVAQVHSEFGPLKIETSNWQDATLEIIAAGRQGKLRLGFTFDASAEQRIETVGIEPADDGARGPKVPPPPLASTMSPSQMSAAIDTWVAPYVQHDDFSGVIMIARNAKPLVVKAYGLADRERKVPLDAGTTFNIASIGKKYTQTVIARLIEQGKLKLTTTIADIIPDYPNELARSATVDQLISMKGGIADFFGPGFNQADKKSLNSNHAYYLYVSKLPQKFKPGSNTEYCNGCYIVLGEMAERASGKSFESNVADIVFRPAHMERSGYFNAASLPANTAIRYGRVRGPEAPYENTNPFHGATGSGAGGVYSTAGDLLAFDNALREGKLLGPEMTAWVLQGIVTKGRNPAPMGVAGGAPGTNAILDSWDDWAVIVLANVDPQLPESMGMAIAKRLR